MKTKLILAAFDKFKSQIDAAYAQARELLAKEQYVQAQQVLAQIAKSHAKTSLSLRNVLIRDGHLKEDR